MQYAFVVLFFFALPFLSSGMGFESNPKKRPDQNDFCVRSVRFKPSATSFEQAPQRAEPTIFPAIAAPSNCLAVLASAAAIADCVDSSQDLTNLDEIKNLIIKFAQTQSNRMSILEHHFARVCLELNERLKRVEAHVAMVPLPLSVPAPKQAAPPKAPAPKNPALNAQISHFTWKTPTRNLPQKPQAGDWKISDENSNPTSCPPRAKQSENNTKSS